MSTVYRKTEKGQAEIDTRTFRLTPRLRQALILVDGRKSDDELSRLIAADTAGVLATLREQGFIESLSTSPSAPPFEPRHAEPEARRSSEALPATATKPPASIDALRRDAVRHLNDQLGPAAEVMAIKIERAKSLAELRPLLVNASQLLANVRGSEAGRAFTSRFLGHDSA